MQIASHPPIRFQSTLPAAHMPVPTPLFGAEPERQAPRKKSALQTLWHGALRVAPLSNLLGGLLLIGSAFIPGTPAKPVDVSSSPPAAVAPAGDAAVNATGETIAPATQAVAENGMADVKDMMARLGWMLASVGMMGTKFNIAAAGKEKKQPSMVLGGLWGMGMASVMFFDPSVPVRIAFLTASAMLINGYGNMVQNEYRLKKGEKPRDFDMSPLYSQAALKNLMGPEADASSRAMLRAWSGHLAGMGRFVVEDHVRMVGKTAKAIRYIGQHPVKSAGKVQEQTVHLLRYLTRRTKEQPDFVRPGDTQNQIGSMLIYAGGIPWLLLSGSVAGVEQVCQTLIAAGSLTADLSLVGVGGAEKGINRAVAFGPLLINGGIPWVHTNAGMGVGLVGNAVIDEYFARQATATSNEPPKEETASAEG